MNHEACTCSCDGLTDSSTTDSFHSEYMELRSARNQRLHRHYDELEDQLGQSDSNSPVQHEQASRHVLPLSQREAVRLRMQEEVHMKNYVEGHKRAIISVVRLSEAVCDGAGLFDINAGSVSEKVQIQLESQPIQAELRNMYLKTDSETHWTSSGWGMIGLSVIDIMTQSLCEEMRLKRKHRLEATRKQTDVLWDVSSATTMQQREPVESLHDDESCEDSEDKANVMRTSSETLHCTGSTFGGPLSVMPLVATACKIADNHST